VNSPVKLTKKNIEISFDPGSILNLSPDLLIKSSRDSKQSSKLGTNFIVPKNIFGNSENLLTGSEEFFIEDFELFGEFK
jgi:hypothetical protein